jgi:DNA-binding GntR family transcriptional regulator
MQTERAEVPQPRATRTERAYASLREDLLRGRWQTGDILSAYALSEELQISRTPVMEALKRLEQEGFVEIIPQVGCRVMGPTPGALLDLFSIRAALEGAAAPAAARWIGEDALAEQELLLSRLDAAAERGDQAAYGELNERFHLLVVDASRIPRLAELARTVWMPLRHQVTYLPLSDAQVRESAAEHRELHEALRHRSPRRARLAAERHARLAAGRFAVALEPRQPDELVHRALIYRDEPELLAASVPFVLDGLDAAERVLAVTTPQSAEALVRALGRRAAEVEFRDSADWYLLPSHTLLSYERYIEQSDRPRVRVIGEMAWNGGSPAPMSEWIRYESIINAAFASQPVTFMCPYDVRALPEPIVADARRTHPELVHGTVLSASEDFVDATTLLRELDADPLEPPPAGVSECAIDRDLRAVRGFILDQVKRAGVSGKAIQDAFLAVQDVAADVSGRGTVRAWVDGGELLFEVRDDGAGIGDPMVGQLSSDPSQRTEPRGLWLARLLCDLVEVRSTDRGLVVRLHVSAG